MNNLSARKATCNYKIVDKAGNPISNATVKFNLINHEFLFGCGAFDFTSYFSETDETKKSFLKERMDKWLEVFNYGTLDFYWGKFEPEEGKPKTQSRMDAAKYLKSHGVIVKGHPLCWHTACADWLLKYDNQTILQKQLARIERDVSAFKGVIDMWDVINEVVIMPHFDRYDNAVTRICRELGQVPTVKAVFNEAYKNNPAATLLINDFNLSESYVELIKKCLDAGAQISAIGLQSHQHQGYWGREKLEATLARFEPFGIPLHFTENTLVSGPLVPAHIQDLNDYQYNDDDSTPELEERQKNQMEDMYRIVFEEHPLVKAITTWDFTDGMWLNAPSGFLHRDNSEKSAYTMMKDLIHKEYHTELSAKTDINGFVELSGFKGKYDVCVDSEKSESGIFKTNVTLGDESKSGTIVIETASPKSSVAKEN